jgi:hypothetical protein
MEIREQGDGTFSFGLDMAATIPRVAARAPMRTTKGIANSKGDRSDRLRFLFPGDSGLSNPVDALEL